jgi:hypothetical protein
VHEAIEDPGREPAWIYFYSPAYLTLQRGLASRLLGRFDDAVELLTAGLAATEDALRGSEFVANHVVHLADTHIDAGNADIASGSVEEAGQAATKTGSSHLAAEVARLSRRLDP